MDSFDFVPAVKAEKAKAAGRNMRARQLKTIILHVLEVCLALTLLLSLYSTELSLAVDSAIDRALQLLTVLRKPFSVFILSNVIIVVVAFLSANNTNKKNPAVPVDIYEEYLSRCKIAQSPAPARTPADKLMIVPYTSQPEREPETEKAVVRVEEKQNSEKAVVRAEEKKKNSYRRARSAVAVARPPRRPKEAELRRSMTENGRSSVDDLSNEEFNQTVESYIARTRWLLQKEITADLTESVLTADRAIVVRS